MSNKNAVQYLKEFFNVYPQYSYSVAELRAIFGISQKEKSSFKQLLQSLVKDEFLDWGVDKKYRLADKKISTSPKAVSDRIEIAPKKEGISQVKGRIYKAENLWRVQQAGMHQPNYILPQDISPYKDGDKVIFQVVGEEHAEIVAGIETELSFEDVKARFLKDNDLKPHFPKAVGTEVAPVELPVFDPSSQRKDFRDLHTVCIDPFGARDHDDAISLEKSGSGWTLGVHIADVSHYVQEDSALDKEALQRSFTQYLPWQAVHMLPEKLSSNLCSLKVGEERLAFSCMVQLSAAGVVKGFEFVKSYVKVDEFHTYEEAMEIAEAKPRSAIARLRRVTRLLNERRKSKGVLLFDMPETKVAFDDFGEPQGLEQKHHIESMNWIEECMLMANQCCAQFLKSKELPGVYREHAFPKEDEVRELASAEPELFKGAGSLDQYFTKVKDPDSNVHEGFFDLFKILVDNAQGDLNKTRKVLRAMQKADYRPEGKGHFALRWNDYAHFTSPIRRYADLIVHRQMSAFLSKKALPHTEDDMDEVASKISTREIEVMKIERRGVKFCGAWMAQDYLGEELEGRVSGMQDFGLFVEIPGMGFEGLVKYRTMPGDFYIYNEEKGYVYGRRTGRRILTGDDIRIVVSKVNVMKGEVDFECVSLGDDKHSSKPAKTSESIHKKKSESQPRKSSKQFSEDGSGGEAFNPWTQSSKKEDSFKKAKPQVEVIEGEEPTKKEKEAWSSIKELHKTKVSKKRVSRKLKDNEDKYENSWKKKKKAAKKSSGKMADSTIKMVEDDLAIFDEILGKGPEWNADSPSRNFGRGQKKSKGNKPKRADAQETWRKKTKSPKSKNPNKDK